MVNGGTLNSLSNFQLSKGARKNAYLDEEALSWSRRRCLQDDRRHSSEELINTEYAECVYTCCEPCRRIPPRIMSVPHQVWINCLQCASPENIRIKRSRLSLNRHLKSETSSSIAYVNEFDWVCRWFEPCNICVRIRVQVHLHTCLDAQRAWSHITSASVSLK